MSTDIISDIERKTDVPMTDPIYVIDLETTGLDGYPTDHVVEIGIAKYDQLNNNVTAVYDAVIRVPDIREIHANKVERDGTRGCWVFNHTSLTLEDVENGRPLEEVVEEVRHILNGKAVTAYNIPFDFDRFLDHEPWDLDEITQRRKDVAKIAKDVIVALLKDDTKIPDAGLREKLRAYHERRPDGIFASEDAYKVLCADDPAGVGMVQKHRALDDAIREAWIMHRASRTMAWAFFGDWLSKLLDGLSQRQGAVARLDRGDFE